MVLSVGSIRKIRIPKQFLPPLFSKLLLFSLEVPDEAVEYTPATLEQNIVA